MLENVDFACPLCRCIVVIVAAAIIKFWVAFLLPWKSNLSCQLYTIYNYYIVLYTIQLCILGLMCVCVCLCVLMMMMMMMMMAEWWQLTNTSHRTQGDAVWQHGNQQTVFSIMCWYQQWANNLLLVDFHIEMCSVSMWMPTYIAAYNILWLWLIAMVAESRMCPCSGNAICNHVCKKQRTMDYKRKWPSLIKASQRFWLRMYECVCVHEDESMCTIIIFHATIRSVPRS